MRLAVIEQNIHFLTQGADLLRRLDDDLYAAAGPGERGSGIGPHLRHCIDFYRCFLRDIGTGRLDYDRRARQPAIETERAEALAALEEIIEDLAGLEEPEGRSVVVRTDRAPFEDPAESWSRSTVGRELRFLASHTVHHYAIISLLLRARGFEPEEGFGVAPSTLVHWQAAH